MMAFVPEEKRDPGVIAFLEGRAAQLARRSSTATSPTASGSPPTASTTADLSCVGYLYFDDEFGLDLADYPNVAPLARRDRRAARLEAPLRPDARPPDPRPDAEEHSHARRLSSTTPSAPRAARAAPTAACTR